MTAALFFIDPDDLPGDAEFLVLDGAQGRHAADVQRIGTGEHLLVGDGHGRIAECTVSTANRGRLELTVDRWRPVEPAPDPQLVLVQALAKGDRDLLAIQAATELDVDQIVPWQAERCIVRWRADRAAKGLRKWSHTIQAGARQARRSRVPGVDDPVGLAQLEQRVRRVSAAFILHEDADLPFSEAEIPDSGEVLLIVGPEGGISPAEATRLSAAGAQPVRLGRSVLRTSTAGPAALAALHTRKGWR